MINDSQAALHDAYATDYDAQVVAYDCHVAEMLFGLAFEYVLPGQRLLDVGIGTGLSSELFAKAGLEVHGMDFSPAMLQICADKGFAATLRQHDAQKTPWPVESGFDHVVCCGVLHFVADLQGIFAESARALRTGGFFAFTTRAPDPVAIGDDFYERQSAGAFDIYSHTSACVEAVLAGNSFAPLKTQRVCVGEDLFVLWVAEQRGR
jgi:predicted TPR repeat methyltransferase